MSELKVTAEMQRYLESIVNQKVNQALQQRKDAVMTDEQKEFSNERKGYFKKLRDSLLSVVYSKPSLTQLWAETGSVTAPSLPQQSAGWNSSLPPTTYTFNFLQQIVEQYLLHINQQGICVWDGLTDYPVHALSKGSNGNIYRGLTTPNVGNDPITDSGANWFLINGSTGSGIAHCAQVTRSGALFSFMPAIPATVPWNAVANDDFSLWNGGTFAFILDETGYWDFEVLLNLWSSALNTPLQCNIFIVINDTPFRTWTIQSAPIASQLCKEIIALPYERLCNAGDVVKVEIEAISDDVDMASGQFFLRYIGAKKASLMKEDTE